ncbi:hypothetical protein DsansV1_C01g0008641 [Dioscorea sansibarensis]
MIVDDVQWMFRCICCCSLLPLLNFFPCYMVYVGLMFFAIVDLVQCISDGVFVVHDRFVAIHYFFCSFII